MTDNSSVPENVLAALDRLNGHARAGGCGKETIYAYKLVAAICLAREDLATVQPVQVTATCISCGGDGLWKGYHPEDGHEPCRRCSRSGKVTLRFVEMRAGARVWHHPYPSPGVDVLHAAWGNFRTEWSDKIPGWLVVMPDGSERPLKFEPAGEWTPQRAGEKLVGESLAELMNIVEAWLRSINAHSAMVGQHFWRLEQALRLMAAYSLDLGRAAGPCCICGNGETTQGLRHLRKHLSWSTPCCDGHQGLCPSEWPKDVPESLMTPAVRTWLENPARAERRAA